YLLRRPSNKIVIGTNMIASAKKLVDKKNNPNLTAEAIDVLQDPDKLKELVNHCDIVVSYVPAYLHETVANACLAGKKHMVTSSYVSESLKNLDEKVREAGLIFMNEIGL